MQFLHQQLLFLSECRRVIRVYCWEVHIQHLICLTAYDAGAILEINSLKHTTVIHLPQRITLDNLCLSLKLQDCNRLMHHRHQAQSLLGELIMVLRIQDWFESSTRVISIRLHSEGSKRHQAYTIAIIEGEEISITQ